MSGEGMGASEEMFLKKKRIRYYNFSLRSRCTIHKYDRATGKLKSIGGPYFNTMDTTLDGGIDLFLQLITNSGTGASSHLNTGNTFLVVGNADPIGSYGGSTNIPVFSTPTSVNFGATPIKSAPSDAAYWQWDDDSTTVRTNQNRIEVWYLDPDDPGMTGNPKRVNNILVSEGTKPSDENWHWRITFEFYSTDGDFESIIMGRFLDLIAGDGSNHMDTTRTFLRPYLSAGTGLGSAGINPDSVVVATGPNTITLVMTAADGIFNGNWLNMEIGIGTTYTSGFARLRFGGCTTAGATCGDKGAGEEYEYTYVMTLAQGS